MYAVTKQWVELLSWVEHEAPIYLEIPFHYIEPSWGGSWRVLDCLWPGVIVGHGLSMTRPFHPIASLAVSHCRASGLLVHVTWVVTPALLLTAWLLKEFLWVASTLLKCTLIFETLWLGTITYPTFLSLPYNTASGGVSQQSYSTKDISV